MALKPLSYFALNFISFKLKKQAGKGFKTEKSYKVLLN